MEITVVAGFSAKWNMDVNTSQGKILFRLQM
jgi:hypothetical protein